MQNTFENLQPNYHNGMPLILRIAKPVIPDPTVYSGSEGYCHESQNIIGGVYFMGSPKKNTRCNRATLFGSDKTYADDTKEK